MSRDVQDCFVLLGSKTIADAVFVSQDQTEEDAMRIVPVGHALSLFLAITFTICIVWGLVTPPAMHMHEAWEMMMPGFQWLSFPAFLIGVAWAYFFGWYAALVFVPLYNLFNKRNVAA